MRYGDLLIEKMGNEIKRDRLRNLEYLGNDMIDAGIAFGPSTVYGNALVKVGKTQQQLGQTEKDFVLNSYRTFIIPFRKFLDEDMKTIVKERKVLETKRLDLDAAKSRLRKAKSMETQANVSRDCFALLLLCFSYYFPYLVTNWSSLSFSLPLSFVCVLS